MSAHVEIAATATAYCDDRKMVGGARDPRCHGSIEIDRQDGATTKAGALRALKAKAKAEGWTVTGERWGCPNCCRSAVKRRPAKHRRRRSRP